MGFLRFMGGRSDEDDARSGTMDLDKRAWFGWLVWWEILN